MKSIFCVGLIVDALTGCFSSSVDFETGWATSHIEGTMLDSAGGELGGEAFIIVLEYFPRFVQFSDEQPIYIPRARLVRLQDGGRFRIQFDIRASAIETVFITPQSVSYTHLTLPTKA